MTDAAPANNPAETGPRPGSDGNQHRPHWVVVHACQHCTYLHRVGFHAAPSCHVEYRYECPLTGKGVAFNMLNTMLPEPGTNEGVIFATPVA